MSLRELAAKSNNRQATKRGMKGIRRRGYRAERELVRKLRRLSYSSVRIPVSAPSSEALPDVFATKGSCILAFEVKAPRAERAYFRRKQVEKLFGFLDMFEAYDGKLAILAGKFPYRWVFKRVEAPGDYTVRRDEKSNIKLGKIKV
ncbi:MAG: endonuclease [Candidatus Bathyarchaeota archaeon]|nr:endonuclease [Candidatus Bathyarchaeota archaeon]